MNDPTEAIVPVEHSGSNVMTSLARAELDVLVASAKRYPRNVPEAIEKAAAMIRSSRQIAKECRYVFTRGGKEISGPSIRLAEIIMSCYGNLRVYDMVVIEQDWVVARGFGHDLESGNQVSSEVRLNITHSEKNPVQSLRGKRFNDDMIAMTANRAAAVARRNVIFSLVPRVITNQLQNVAIMEWLGGEDMARQRLQECMEFLAKASITEEMVLDYFNLDEMADLELSHIGGLIDILQSVKRRGKKFSDYFQMDHPSRRTAENAAEPNLDAITVQTTLANTASQSNTALPDPVPHQSNAALSDPVPRQSNAALSDPVQQPTGKRRGRPPAANKRALFGNQDNGADKDPSAIIQAALSAGVQHDSIQRGLNKLYKEQGLDPDTASPDQLNENNLIRFEKGVAALIERVSREAEDDD